MSARKLASYAKIFYAWQIRKSLAPSYMPEDISVEATNACNFRCAFCPQSDPRHHELVPRITLEPERAAAIFKRLREGGVTTPTLHWTLDGEPFMNKKFAALCGIAIDHGFTNMIFATNGMLLSEQRLRELPVSPQTKYTFTIDYCADAEYFEEVRGKKGSWQVIQDNIRASLGNNSQQHLHFQLSDITAYKTHDAEVRRTQFEKLNGLFAGAGGRINFRAKTFHNSTGLTTVPASNARKDRYYTCPYPWTSLVVASDGRVVACCRDLRRQTVLGNLLDEPLEAIWRGAAAQELRRNLALRTPWKSKACDGCDMPYDASKFSLRNLIRTARGRLQIFAPGTAGATGFAAHRGETSGVPSPTGRGTG